jgi:glycosyltransferase involved in cell wall biosynthesis
MGGVAMRNVVIVSFNTRGGLHHYITQLSNALAEKTEVDLVLPRGAELDQISSKVIVREMDLGNTKHNFVASTIQFWKVIEVATYIRDRQPSVVHFNGVYPWMAFLLPMIRDLPTVMTVHDITPHPGNSKTDIVAVRDVLLSFADRVIVHGDYARDNITGVRKDIVRIVPHGNYTFFDAGSNGRSTDTDTFLFFGRISKYKGIHHLIQAVNELNAEGRDVRLIIAGEGDLTPYQAEIEGRPWFEVHNRYVPDDEVTQYFDRSFAVVLPYIEVTQSGVVQVALAFKKPVISTRVGCLPEIIKDGVNGRMVEPGDVPALKRAMVQLAEDKVEAARMVLRGYELAGSEYSWDRIADMTIAVYEESAKGNTKQD